MPKIYTTEFKDEVAQFYERGHSIKETLAEYNISESSLFEWKKSFDLRYPDYVGAVLKRRDGFKHADHERKLEEVVAIMKFTRCKATAPVDQKMAIIDKLSDQYSIHVLCEALHLPRGTYYNRKRNEGQLNRYQQADNEIKPLIKEIFLKSGRRFGRKPIHYKLLEMGYRVSETRIARLMSEMGLKVARPEYIAQHLKSLPREQFQDLLHQEFHQVAPNLVWVTDVTYVKVQDHYLYVCVVLDLFSRMALSYSISDHCDTPLVTQAFDIAFVSRNRPKGLMLHSDQGVQYTSYSYQKHLHNLGVKQSFSHAGTPYDNSVCESFFHTMKKEAIYHHLYSSTQDLKKVIEEYLTFYNSQRPHRKLGMETPTAFEAGFKTFQEKYGMGSNIIYSNNP